MRFNLYAARVRELSFRDETLELRPDFLKMLKCYFPPSAAVLPNLQALRLVRPCTDAEFALCFSSLLHPGLSAAELASASVDSVIMVLSNMQLCCPHVAELTIAKVVGVLPMLGQFTHLRTLVYDSPEDAND